MQIVFLIKKNDSIKSRIIEIIHSQKANIKFANLKNSIEDSKESNNISKYNIITINIFLELSNVVE
ncbi:MAG: hypothetical protein ACI4ON_00825 [Clostridia bacterium]